MKPLDERKKRLFEIEAWFESQGYKNIISDLNNKGEIIKMIMRRYSCTKRLAADYYEIILEKMKIQEEKHG